MNIPAFASLPKQPILAFSSSCFRLIGSNLFGSASCGSSSGVSSSDVSSSGVSTSGGSSSFGSRSFIFKLFALLWMLPLFSAGPVQAQSKTAIIVDAAKGDTISILEWAQRLSTADVVFFGEQHDDSITHLLQYQLFEALHQLNNKTRLIDNNQLNNKNQLIDKNKPYNKNDKQNKKIILSMEMFETDRQTVLNEYLLGLITEAQFTKDAAIWNNYKDYRPLIEYAKKQKLAVVAANTPRRYVNMVSRKGMNILDSLPKESKAFLPPLPYDTLGGAYREKFFNLMGGHGVGGPSNIFYSQNLWDATMSWSIWKSKSLKQNRNALVYHLCGRFHSDDQLGTVAQLKKRAPKWNIKTITALPPALHGEAYSEKDKKPIADFIVFVGQ